MTWNELQHLIAEMTADERETDVTVYVDSIEEFFALEYGGLNPSEEHEEHFDVLDAGHPYLTTESP